MAVKKSDRQLQEDRTAQIMNTIAWRAAYYRANPQRFAADYLNLKLKWFQKILLWCMMHFDNFYYVAARSQGKTFLVAIFCVIRCLLFPKTKIKVASATFKQAKFVVKKITDELMHESPLLRAEIKNFSTGDNNCLIDFKCGSSIEVVVASDTARGGRANILIIDESRMVSDRVVASALRPMCGTPRQPGYLNKPEYAHLQEVNKEIHMSSAYYAQSEMFEKVKSYFANMLDPNLKFFVCDLPYMLSIKEGLLMPQTIENEMADITFNEVNYSMERLGLFYGSAEDALFTYKMMDERRILNDALLPLEYYRINNLKIPDKKKGELRVLSVDVALMASKKHDNDASALIIHSAMPTSSHRYMDNVVYLETQEGLITDELGLLIMRFYYQYNCDYIVLDCVGAGSGVYDFLMTDRYDPMYGTTYPALSCCNNTEMADRCKVKGAAKVIWAIKATAQSNSAMMLALRSGIQNGYVNLLKSEEVIEPQLPSMINHYKKLTDNMQTQIKLPYIQTTFLINEMINLEHEMSNNLIKVHEKTGMRKDRYSSFEYGYWVIQELSKNLKPKTQDTNKLIEKFVMKKPELRRYGIM